MPTPNNHALLSASSAHRWLACTAAPHFEENFPNGTSTYAEEGTLAHSICELYARKKFSVMTTRKFNAELKKLQAQPLYQDEMLKTAEAYVEYLTEKAMAYTSTPHVAIEVKVDLTDYIPDGFGTCDCIMVGGDTLHITDYKHGKGVPVDAVGNPQMRLYALGALKLYSAVYGDQIKRVSMGICQPRLSETASEDSLTAEELLAWGNSIKPIAREAYDGPGTFCPGDHCRFCKGKTQCRARAAHFAGFSDFVGLELEGRMTEEKKAERECRAAFGAELSPMVRLHKFGEKDDDAAPDTPVVKLPSYKAMCELAVTDKLTIATLNREQHEQAMKEFEGMGKQPDTEDEGAWAEALQRTQDGKIKSTIDNVLIILDGDPLLKGKFALNKFAGRGEVLGALPWEKSTARRLWSDTDSNGLYWYMERFWGITSRGNMLYAHRFFKTKENAKAFQRKHGGALYSNAPGSRTKQDYLTEAAMAEMTEKQREERPFCVAWNVVDDGPIKPDELEVENT